MDWHTVGTEYYALSTMHCPVSTMHYALCTMHCALGTLFNARLGSGHIVGTAAWRILARHGWAAVPRLLQYFRIAEFASADIPKATAEREP